MMIGEQKQIKTTEWISVKNRLPEMDVDVLMLFSEYGQMAVGSILYQDDAEHWTCNIGGQYYTDSTCAPDFWMPLPEPPKE